MMPGALLARRSREGRTTRRPVGVGGRFLPLAVALAMLLLPAGSASAQTDRIDEALEDLEDPIEDLGDWQDRPAYSLSLRETLAMTMDNNLDIAVQDFETEVSVQGEDTARSAYDSTLTSVYDETEINSQNADPFSGPALFEIKNRTFTTNWNDPTIWGGNFNVFFSGQKQKSTFSGLQPQYSTSLNLTYQQSVLRFWGLEVNQAPIKIAQNNTRISESQFRDQVMASLEAAESAYWELVFAREDFDVKIQSLDLAKNLLRINRAKVKVGTLAPIDVTQAEAGVASRMEDLIVSIGNLLNAEDTLRQLINPPDDHPIWDSTLMTTEEPTFDETVDPDEGEALQIARARRPELEQQRLRLENNTMQEKIDRKAKRWDLVVEGRYNLEGLEGKGTRFVQDSPVECLFPSEVGDGINIDIATGAICRDLDSSGTFTPFGEFSEVTFLDTDIQDAIEGFGETEFADWTVRATLTIPIGNRALKARHATSTLRRDQSRVQLQNLVLAAETDVKQKVRNVVVNIRRVKAAQKNRELQQKNVDAEEKKYENGMSTSFQVLEIQEDLAAAESQENRAKIDYQKSLAALERAKGTLLEARNVQLTDRGSRPDDRIASALGHGR